MTAWANWCERSCAEIMETRLPHTKGVEAEQYIKEAKETLAKIWKVQEKEVFFTSGGTESDNLALIGAARANQRAGKHLITTSIEHPAIINTMRYLEEEGFRITFLPVDRYGRGEAGCPEGCIMRRYYPGIHHVRQQ